MGGCCCCSSRTSESDRAPVHIYHRQNLGEHDPSPIVAVDTNLDTSTPDTYQAPPAPLPYDVGLTIAENPDSCADFEKPDIKSRTDEQQSLEGDGYEACEKGAPEDKSDEEDVCPICLEEYDEENPRSITKCEHHFHLCCMLEWMERSNTCPVCDQIALIDEMYE